MKSFPMDYAGDERFEEMLIDLSCPMTLPEVKMLILGSISATEMVMPSRLLNVLWNGAPPTFKNEEHAREFFTCMMGLWNELSQYPDSQQTYCLTRFTEATSKIDLQERLNTRKAEVNSFVKGLGIGNTNPEQMLPPGREALEILAKMDAFTEQYIHLLEKETPRDFEETNQMLDQQDSIVEESINIITQSQKEQRRHTIQHLKTRQPTTREQNIGRNDPCHCGSGKKYKKCCGANM